MGLVVCLSCFRFCFFFQQRVFFFDSSPPKGKREGLQVIIEECERKRRAEMDTEIEGEQPDWRLWLKEDHGTVYICYGTRNIYMYIYRICYGETTGGRERRGSSPFFFCVCVCDQHFLFGLFFYSRLRLCGF